MRILVQQKYSKRYFKDIDQWTRNHLEAMDFRTSTKAIEFCFSNRILDVQLVMKFDEQEYDIILPLTAEPGRKGQRDRRSNR
jgi:hypothetical protein